MVSWCRGQFDREDRGLVISDAGFGRMNEIFEKAISPFRSLPKGTLEQALYFFVPTVKVQRTPPQSPPEMMTEPGKPPTS